MQESYAGDEPRPLGTYALLMAAYGTAVAGLAALLHRGGVELPERVSLGDLLLIGVATHKLSRLLAKDPVTSPLRAPFTRFAGVAGPSELMEEPRGHGHAVGELVVCPFCLGQWVATGFVYGFVTAPRPTRLVASVLGALSIEDFLQFAYAAVRGKVEN